MKRNFLNLIGLVKEHIVESEKNDNIDENTKKQLLSFSYLIDQYFAGNNDFEGLKSYLEKEYNSSLAVSDGVLNATPGKTTTQWQDFRIKRLLVDNFRKFPKSDKPFCVNFCRENGGDESPGNLILVGNNGAGKSSLYAALEFIFSGSVSEARLREYDVERFITHNNNAPQLHTISIETVNNSFSSYKLFSDYNHIPVDACFCSEYDIIQIGKSDYGNPEDNKWDDFFLENLGWGNALVFRDYYKNYKDEFEKKAKELESLRIQIKEYDKKIDHEKLKIVRKIKLITGLSEDSTYKSMVTSLLKDIPVIEKAISGENTITNKLIAIDELKKSLSRSTGKLNEFITQNDELIDVLQPDIDNLRKELEGLQDYPSVENAAEFENDIENKQDLLSAIKNFDLYEKTQEYRKLISLMKKAREPDLSLFIPLEISLQGKRGLELRKDRLTDETENLVSPEYLKKHQEFIEVLKEFFTGKLKDILRVIKEPITEVMDLFMRDDHDHSFFMDDTEDQISIWILINEDMENKIPPKKYYNTFRYKLFCMTLKIATAIAVMKHNKINFPIILDDVFYASDYHNRLKIKRFMAVLLDILDKVMIDERQKLQLICFTHDELVLEAIKEAAVKKGQRKDFIFGRLLDCNQLVEAARFTENNKSHFNRYIADHTGGDSYKLYMELYKN